jgi:hypothetical protein
MSFEEKKESEMFYDHRKFKSLICRAKECKHNMKTSPICTHEWVEIEEDNHCIFMTPSE